MDVFHLTQAMTLLAEGGAGLFVRYLATSGLFVLVAIALRTAPAHVRRWGQLAASVVLMSVLATPLVVALLVAYMALLFVAVERLPRGAIGTALVTALVALQIVAPIWWLPHLPQYEGRVREYVAFATNLTLLRSWAFAWDRRTGADRDPSDLGEFLHFMFFLPAFMAGPLVSLDDFRRGRLASYWDDAAPRGPLGFLRAEWWGLVRVGVGIVAMALAFGVVCTPGSTGYEHAAAGTPLDAWTHVFRVWVCIYLGLTTWTEGGIGFGRLAGFALPENLARPFLSYGVADFWRRWNMTLNLWTRRYLYLPLGGAAPRRRSGERRPEWRNTIAVFVFMAVYHLAGGVKLLGFGYFPPGSYAPWLLWGIINAAGVLATRRLGPLPRDLRRAIPGVVLTGAYCALGIMTAFFPPRMDLGALAAIYRRLLFLD
ncbi:MAG TPA: MBOAT family O-acyltransferase [Candidatus Eisenbacteria bacterium]|nr:MBOAT family O-acyltransferase [Candidatus Eisenbacteria bacterium]